MTFRIAGYNFEVNINHAVTKWLLRDYLCNEAPDATLEITDADLARFDGQCGAEEREFYALHDVVAHRLLPHDVLLFHGSCLALDGNGILFTAPSGTGKSTHARLWRERFGYRVTMLNDDKPLLQYDRAADGWTAWGTPWCGKEGIHTNTSAPLRCIVLIRQGAENAIRELSAGEAAEQFLQQALIPADDFAMRLKSLDLIGHLAQLPVYELTCTISQEAVALSFAALNRQQNRL